MFESLFFSSFLFCFVDRGEAFRETVLIDVKLVVELRIWIACEPLVCHIAKAVHEGRARGLLPAEQIVGLLEVFKVLQLGLELLICRLVRAAILFNDRLTILAALQQRLTTGGDLCCVFGHTVDACI